MEGTLLSWKKFNTKFGEKVLAQVQLTTGETIEIWETPKEVDCISTLPITSVIAVTRTSKGSYKWVPGALVGDVTKRAIAKHSDFQMRLLIYLHLQFAELLKESGLIVSDFEVQNYVLSVYTQLVKEFNL